MIPTSAHAGSTATTRRQRPLLAALLALAVVLGIAAPAQAETTPSPSPTGTGTVTLTVAPLSGGIVASGEGLGTIVALENTTSARAPGGTAELHLGDTALASRDDLTAWLAGTGSGQGGTILGSTALDEAGAGQTSSSGILVGAEDEALRARAAGVYPLWLTLGERTARSVVTIGTSASGPVAVIVPITAGPLTSGLLSIDQLTELTGEDGALTAQLDAVEGTSAILAVDPAIVAAIRVRGTAAPESARAWLARLLGLGNQRFALQFGDADVSAQVAAGLDAPLQPTSLVSYVDASAVPEAATPTPAPTEPDGEATSPAALEELLDIGAPVAPTVYWPPSGTASAALANTLAAASPGSYTLVDAAQVDDIASARATSDEAALLIVDDAASAALRSASVSSQPATRADAIAAAAAHLAFATQAAGGAPVLVTVGRANERDAQGLRAAILAATTTVPTGLVQLTTADAVSATITDGVVDAARAGAVTTLLDGADQIGRFATVLDDPDLLTGRERASSLQVLGAGWLDDDAAWQAAMTEHTEATRTTLGSVDIVPSTALNLLTAGANLRFWVRNDLPYPVNVVLIAAPDDLRVDIDHETPVTAIAAANTLVEVPVNARIGNGDVKIDLSLRSPAFVSIGTAQTVDVNVRADWEGIGLVVLSVLAAGFLSLGVVRTVRRRRRGAHGDETDAAAPNDQENA